jgi:hypothetical protein
MPECKHETRYISDNGAVLCYDCNLVISSKATANERQVAGEHYKKHGDLQHWDIVIKFGLDYFQGQITKYVMRWKDKGGVQDLEKARHFLDKYIEIQIENYIKAQKGSGKP